MADNVLAASVVTETNTVDVTLVDSGNYSYTYKLDDPKTGLTLAQVKAAFQPAFDKNLLYSQRGNLFTAVSKAVMSTSSKYVLEGGSVAISPASLEEGSVGSFSQVFTITDGVFTAAMPVLYSNYSSAGTFETPVISSDGSTATIAGTVSDAIGDQVGYIIFTVNGNATVEVPITFGLVP